MDSQHLDTVDAPLHPVYRVAYGPDPFVPRDWAAAGDDGTFGNRFDDPGGMSDLSERRSIVPTRSRFRMIYCASTATGAYGETIARFRPSLRLLAMARQIDDDEPIDASLFAGVIPADWRHRRRLGMTTLDPQLRFVDLAAAGSMTHLRKTLAQVATQLGLDDIDLSVITSRHRRLTQEIARYIYEYNDGRGAYAGIRYLSRLNPEWECWAIFDTRIRHTQGPSRPIFPGDPDLLAAAVTLGLKPPVSF